MKPQLIDSFCNSDKSESEINGKWYYAKPLPFYGLYEFKKRLYHCWLILRGRATAFQYAEDRLKERNNECQG